MVIRTAILFFLALTRTSACQSSQNMSPKKDANMQTTAATTENTPTGPLEVATLGGGCFWCVEAVYQDLKGVSKVESGYAGGHVDNPSYQEICTGLTGHAEVIQVTFDPAVVSFKDILEVFFTVHDPTTLNRQGNDVGTQYRSVVYYHSPEQKSTTEAVILSVQELFDDPIVTEITAFDKFFKAENYHQNYYKDNPYQPYCAYVITPKVKKFKEKFKGKLKQ